MFLFTKFRVLSCSYTGNAICAVATPYIPEYFDEDLAFPVLITIVVFFGMLTKLLLALGLLSGALQISLYGLLGPLPPKYTAALNAGVGLSGVVICVCRAVSLILLPPSHMPKNFFYGALLYFWMAAFILFLCVAGILILIRLPFTRYHLNRSSTVLQDPKRDSMSTRQNEVTRPTDAMGQEPSFMGSPANFSASRLF